jgi:hypothetical protein
MTIARSRLRRLRLRLSRPRCAVIRLFEPPPSFIVTLRKAGAFVALDVAYFDIALSTQLSTLASPFGFTIHLQRARVTTTCANCFLLLQVHNLWLTA